MEDIIEHLDLMSTDRLVNESGTIPSFCFEDMEPTLLFEEKEVFVGSSKAKAEHLISSFMLQSDKNGMLIFSTRPMLKSTDTIGALLEKKQIAPSSIVSCGTLYAEQEEYRIMKQFNIRNYSMRSLTWDRSIIDTIMEQCVRYEKLFLLLDTSVLGNPTSPRTSISVDARTLLYYLQRLSYLKNLRTIFITGEFVISSSGAAKVAKIIYELS
ncbi:hypothetical protein H6504_00800 [Candidatus Woesearchaeota archaeon]|nr:hypothetical protein [Candidatus Woesearchaeota archaeon]